MNNTEKLKIAISSRALFNLDTSHAIFEKEGVEAYCRCQIENEDVPLGQPNMRVILISHDVRSG